MQPAILAPSGSPARRRRLLAVLTLLLALLALLATRPSQAQTPNWDAPFRTPLYVLHVSESSSQYGPVQRDDYILHTALPDENGTVLVADGYGGVYINRAELFGGPFSTPRQVCEAVQGLPKKKLHVDILGMQCDLMVANCSELCEAQDSDKTWDGVAEHPPCNCICKAGYQAWELYEGQTQCTQCWQYCIDSTGDAHITEDKAAHTPGKCACVCEAGYALGPSGKCEASTGPAPQTGPYYPSITLNPEEGAGGSEVEVTGEGFPPGTLVELRWEKTDGILVGEGQSDASGRVTTSMTVPPDAEEGEHDVVAVYSDAGQQRTVSARFFVRELCIQGKVRVRMRDGWPLQGVSVSLWWSDPTQLTVAPVRVQDTVTGGWFVATGADGSYRICSPLIGVPSRDWLLQVSLSDVAFGSFEVVDEPAEDLAMGLFGSGGSIGAHPNNPTTWFAVETAADLQKDLWFEDLEDNAETPAVREDHALDAALIYYHLHQAVRVYRALGVAIGPPAVQVFAYSDRPTAAGAAGLDINEAVSDWNAGNAPKNREWHELSHYVMWLGYGGRFPPGHYEAPGSDGDINGNHIPDRDTNHGGYLANALSSSDAYTEGFAEFMAMVIADQMDALGEPYMQDLVGPYIYTVSGGNTRPQLLNMEINQPQSLLRYLSQRTRTAFYNDLESQRSVPYGGRRIWRILADEELCVASLLWDLYDPVNEAERDGVQLAPQELWGLLTRTYTFPAYYDGELVTRFLGDADVYAGRWSYYNLANEMGSFRGERGLTTPYPTQERMIYYVKDLYDALVLTLPGQGQAIERIFASHRITLDTYRVYEDYAALGDVVLSTFGDAGTQVQASLGPEAAHSFWGQGLVADVTAAGWGSGFTLGRGEPVDARGYVYLWLWMNAPDGVSFDVVIEDDAGQWLCPGTSTALYGMDATPADWPRFQQGTGGWSAYSPSYSGSAPYPYAVVIAPAYDVWWAAGWAHAYECQPNPSYRTPPADRAGPNIAHITGVGVLYKTPGTYRALIGGMMLVADYPWKAGMRTVYGLGDPALGLWLPYRRSRPEMEGAKAIVQVDRVPATVWVSYEYGAPYENLSFQYPIEVTQPSQEIGLYIEPPFEGAENRLRLTAQVEGYAPGEAVVLSSSEYWDLWDAGGIMQVSLAAGTTPAADDARPGGRSGPEPGVSLTEGTLYIAPSWLLGGGLSCLGALTAAAVVIVLLVRRRRRRA